MNGKRSHRNEKLARIFDDEILPIWSLRFGRMMLRNLELPPRANVLDVACGTGYPALEVLKRLDDQGRVIAIDSSPAMLDVARRKAGELAGKRIFFRSENVARRLSFDDDVYDLVLCNLGLNEMEQPWDAVHEFARVCKPGGRVICTMPLAGTWQELYDIYREVLVKHDRHEMLVRLERHLADYPTPEQLERTLGAGGLSPVEVQVEEFTLLFRSAREFFFAPIVEYGPLASWKEIAGKGRDLQDVFWYIKQAIDAYFADRAFEVTVIAGCVCGVKVAAAPRPALGDVSTSREGKAEEHAGPAAGESAEPVAVDDDMVLEEGSVTDDDEELEAFKTGEQEPRS